MTEPRPPAGDADAPLSPEEIAAALKQITFKPKRGLNLVLPDAGSLLRPRGGREEAERP